MSIDKTTADAAWSSFVEAAKNFAPHLDQWEKIKFETDYGMVYVTISRADLHPYSFEEISNVR